jgi:hypothetical protein
MKRVMRLMLASGLLAIGVSSASQGAGVGLVDDFSGDLSAYTSTVILDANGGGSNTSAWQISDGQLQLATTSYNGIEQYAFIYNGLTLDVGFELQVDVVHSLASQDIGLYVGGSSPTFNARDSYLNVYARNATTVYSRGFVDGVGEVSLHGGAITQPAFDTLFIKRDAPNSYELGYYNGDTRVIVSDRNNILDNNALYVGVYADVRAVGTLGSWDNLRIVPEPSTMILAGIGGLALVSLRRRRS